MKRILGGSFGKRVFSMGIGAAAVAAFASVAFCAPSAVEQIANYKGKDREQILVEGAKKEGLLSFYSSMNAKDSQPLVDGFQKKYPFMKVDLFAATGEAVSVRMIAEQKGKKYTADVFCGTNLNVEKVIREGLLIPYYTPYQEIYEKKYMDPDKHWMPMFHLILTFVYNTKEIKEPPKTWQELLEPKWKGKLGIEDTDESWLINFSKFWGEAKAKDYFTRLGKQDMRVVHGHSVMMQMLVAGDVAATPTQYLHQAIAEKQKGAPINFAIMDPMVDALEAITLLKHAPHPHAALLFIDYVVSKEAQTLIQRRGRNPAYPGMDPYVKGANLLIEDPSGAMDKFEYWQKLYKDLLILPNQRR